jgi:predicted acyl esterase
MDALEFEGDRFTEFDSYKDALAAYEAEPTVRVMFETGAGAEAGWPVPRFEKSYDSWPPAEAEGVEWYLGPEGSLVETAPSEGGADLWRFDADAQNETFFGPSGYQVLEPLWDIDWSPFAQGDIASYVTPPFQTSTVVSGPGYAELWIRSPVDDVMAQVTLTEVRPDGNEVLIQSGWLRFGHRKATVGDDFRLIRSFDMFDFEPVPVNEWVSGKLAIPSFAHPIREGSSLRMAVSSPGRDHGTWEFEAPVYESTPTFELGYGGAQLSTLQLATLPGISIPEEWPPCPSLRGQPCRVYTPTPNTSED